MIKSWIGLLVFAGLAYVLDGVFKAYRSPVPAPIVLMALLAIFYTAFGLPDFLAKSAEQLFRVFPLLFIPALVGVVVLLETVADNIWVLLFAVTLSSLLGLVVAGRIYLIFAKTKGTVDD
ncbi:CidA/LrgA family protein [Kordiimonas laminariae]|uniref:CidA/LrgA family protein n=1 Tax=Kordiimonas laminariae TaxID=2917717 RepID=UPI001FF6C7F3|nr:CidA/LrgA family protein [Kordiimonas laminariae]MCK0067927.1 CidA/LrgA family protein [Kordiimonas laminariae]